MSLVAILPAVGIGEVGLSDLGHIGDGHLGGVQDDSVLYGANSGELHGLVVLSRNAESQVSLDGWRFAFRPQYSTTEGFRKEGLRNRHKPVSKSDN